jgi:precorrin-4 methylase
MFSYPRQSSFLAAAASLNREYAISEVSQTVIITRMEGSPRRAKEV